jgi:hypothetical protein
MKPHHKNRREGGCERSLVCLMTSRGEVHDLTCDEALLNGLDQSAITAWRYFEFVILRNSGSGIKPSRLGILIFGKVFLSSFESAGKIPFKLKM